jgi:hypothetical protein
MPEGCPNVTVRTQNTSNIRLMFCNAQAVCCNGPTRALWPQEWHRNPYRYPLTSAEGKRRQCSSVGLGAGWDQTTDESGFGFRPEHFCGSVRILGRMASSGMLRSVPPVRTDVSEELSVSFIRVTRIGEIGTTLA